MSPQVRKDEERGFLGAAMLRVMIDLAICRAIGELRGVLIALEDASEECYAYDAEVREAIEHLEACLKPKR